MHVVTTAQLIKHEVITPCLSLPAHILNKWSVSSEDYEDTPLQERCRFSSVAASNAQMGNLGSALQADDSALSLPSDECQLASFATTS